MGIPVSHFPIGNPMRMGIDVVVRERERDKGVGIAIRKWDSETR